MMRENDRVNRKVCVLMSTYNGEKFLSEQLDSLIAQEGVDVSILVRDDGSSDNTVKILEDYAKKGFIDYYIGKNIGVSNSFMDLLQRAQDADYYSFCDQDDYWYPDKLRIAVSKMEKYISDICLYHGVARVADTNLEWDGEKCLDRNVDDLISSIIQSHCMGCTLVINKNLRNVIIENKSNFYYMHDDWIHKVCLVKRGIILYDKDVHILYRQHGGNVIGARNTLKKKIMPHIKSIRTKVCERSRQLVEFLKYYSEDMSMEEKKVCEMLINYKSNNRIKLEILFGNRIKSKYLLDTLKFKFAIIFNSY